MGVIVANELQLLEVFRLAALGGESGIATEVSDRLSGSWLAVSRFRDVDDLTARTLELERSPTTLNRAGLAKKTLGDLRGALILYQEAVGLLEASGDRRGVAATLNNIGGVYNGLGDLQQALDYYNRALPISEEVGDRTGESVTRYNIAMIHRAEGRLAQAVAELQRVVALDKQIGHPDLEADTAMLNQLTTEIRHEQSMTD